MNQTVMLAVISLIGTVVGALAGVATSAKVTQFRLKILEQHEGAQDQLAEKVAEMEEKLFKLTCRLESQSKELKLLKEFIQKTG